MQTFFWKRLVIFYLFAYSYKEKELSLCYNIDLKERLLKRNTGEAFMANDRETMDQTRLSSRCFGTSDVVIDNACRSYFTVVKNSDKIIKEIDGKQVIVDGIDSLQFDAILTREEIALVTASLYEQYDVDGFLKNYANNQIGLIDLPLRTFIQLSNLGIVAKNKMLFYDVDEITKIAYLLRALKESDMNHLLDISNLERIMSNEHLYGMETDFEGSNEHDIRHLRASHILNIILRQYGHECKTIHQHRRSSSYQGKYMFWNLVGVRNYGVVVCSPVANIKLFRESDFEKPTFAMQRCKDQVIPVSPITVTSENKTRVATLTKRLYEEI